MVSNIVLGASVKSNLLSIINTQRLIDRTTLRLATGLEVSSAIENPKNFFSASALNYRANDLRSLLDNMGMNIRAVEEASNGVEAISKNVEQAQAVAQEAVDILNGADKDPYVEGNVDLSRFADLTALSGITAGDIIQFSTRGNDEIAYIPTAVNITINAGTSINEVITLINNALPDPPFEASLTEEGFFKLKLLSDVQVNFGFISTANTDAANLDLASALGYSEIASLASVGINNENEVQFTLNPSRALTSFSLYNAATNELADSNDLISTLEGVNDTLLFFGLDSAADRFELGVNDETRESLLLDNTVTINDFINNINGNINLRDFLRAEFDDETAKITIRAIDPTIDLIQTAVTSDDNFSAFFGFTNGRSGARANQVDVDYIYIGSVDEISLAKLKNLEIDYDNILQSIDGFTQDAQINGINLLAGDDLTTFFNKDLTSFLVINGVNFSSVQLGLQPADFTTLSSAQNAVELSALALTTVRTFGTTLSNNLAVLETRRDFTEVTINTLEAGAGDLIDADLNEEGANMLALQIRQNLAITALSIGSQQRATILTIFT